MAAALMRSNSKHEAEGSVHSFTRVPQILPLHMWRKINTFCFPCPVSLPSFLLCLSHMRVYKHEPLWISAQRDRIWEWFPSPLPFEPASQTVKSGSIPKKKGHAGVSSAVLCCMSVDSVSTSASQQGKQSPPHCSVWIAVTQCTHHNNWAAIAGLWLHTPYPQTGKLTHGSTF